jgi:uncharacterized membrane protein
MPARKHVDEADAERTRYGLGRIASFSDAVMAIAITLQLAALTPRIISFVISFAVIGVYWSSHHRDFGYIRRYDARLILLNLVFLFFIAIMPFVASLQGQYSFVPLAMAAYAGAVVGTGFSIGGIWWYATYRHRLVDEDLDAGFIRTRSLVALVVPIIFALSIPSAWVSPVLTLAIWWIAPFASIAALRALERRGSG